MAELSITAIVVVFIAVNAVMGFHPFVTGDVTIWDNYLGVAFGNGVFYSFGMAYITFMAHLGDFIIRGSSDVTLANDIVALGTAVFKVAEWLLGFVIVLGKSVIEGLIALGGSA